MEAIAILLAILGATGAAYCLMKSEELSIEFDIAARDRWLRFARIHAAAAVCGIAWVICLLVRSY